LVVVVVFIVSIVHAQKKEIYKRLLWGKELFWFSLSLELFSRF